MRIPQLREEVLAAGDAANRPRDLVIAREDGAPSMTRTCDLQVRKAIHQRWRSQRSQRSRQLPDLQSRANQVRFARSPPTSQSEEGRSGSRKRLRGAGGEDLLSGDQQVDAPGSPARDDPLQAEAQSRRVARESPKGDSAGIDKSNSITFGAAAPAAKPSAPAAPPTPNRRSRKPSRLVRPAGLDLRGLSTGSTIFIEDRS
jgi:hypothetical protein